MNALGIRPHEFDQSTQGTSAKYACVVAENEEESPWEPWHVESGHAADSSVVTVQMMRSDVYVEHRSTQVPEEILNTIADSMSYAGMITQVTEARMSHGAIVVMGPEHAGFIAGRGWSKQDVKQYLFERFGKTKAELRRYGKLHPDLRRRARGRVYSQLDGARGDLAVRRRRQQRRGLDGVPVDYRRAPGHGRQHDARGGKKELGAGGCGGGREARAAAAAERLARRRSRGRTRGRCRSLSPWPRGERRGRDGDSDGSHRRRCDGRGGDWHFVLVLRLLAELPNALAQRAAEVRDLAGAEDHDHDAQNDDELHGSNCAAWRLVSYLCL